MLGPNGFSGGGFNNGHLAWDIMSRRVPTNPARLVGFQGPPRTQACDQGVFAPFCLEDGVRVPSLGSLVFLQRNPIAVRHHGVMKTSDQPQVRRMDTPATGLCPSTDNEPVEGSPTPGLEVTVSGHRQVFSSGQVVTIGRAEDASVRILDRKVSHHHASARYVEGAWTLTESRSRNGTWAGGVRVRSLRVDRPITVRLGGPAGATTMSLRPLDVSGEEIASNDPASAPQSTDRPSPTLPVRPPTPKAVPGPTATTTDTGAGGRSNADATLLATHASGSVQPVMVVRIGGDQQLFPMGMQVRVGRDPSLELVTANPLVTRECHGILTSSEDGAVYTDTSSRGTYLDGRRLRKPLHITESVILRLGDPANGEELGVTPPLSVEQITANHRKHEVKTRTYRGAGMAAALVAVAVMTTALIGAFGEPTASGSTVGSTSAAELAHAEAATVRLLQGSPGNYAGWGSGTLISPNGLILTNGHVAEPQAAGEAVALGAPQASLDPNPPFLTVEITTGQSSPVTPRYRARTVDVDGYLDLAVVQIYATSNGTPVNPNTLHLPYLTLGNVSQLNLDQPVTVLGFPGVSDSDSISVTSGVVSTFVPDPLGHLSDPRFELETTARVAHGNSGGAAIDDAGDLIGVPSLTIPGEGSDVSWRLRSVTEARPLIADAEHGTPYQSHILVASSSHERIQGAGIGTTQSQACNGTQRAPSGAENAYVAVRYNGLPVGLDVAFVIGVPGGGTITDEQGSLPQTRTTSTSGCLYYELTSQAIGTSQLPTGTYTVTLLGGPNLNPLSNGHGRNEFNVMVGRNSL